MENNNLDCPVDFVPINENKARLTAFMVMLLTLMFLYNGLRFIVFFLFVDFCMRAFKRGKYSLLSIISDWIIKLLNIKNKPVDKAPKRFAAGMGMSITALMLILLLFKANNAADIFAVIIIVFAFLESVLGFCAGCHVHSIIKNIFKTNS